MPYVAEGHLGAKLHLLPLHHYSYDPAFTTNRYFHLTLSLFSSLKQILHNKKSKPSDSKSDVNFLTPSIFEGMEPSKYILGSHENVKEHPQNKRYVSTETWRKDYVNCRQKDMNPNVLDHTVELRNSTYGKDNFPEEHPCAWITFQARYTKLNMSPHHTHFSKDEGYYNDLTSREYCHNPKHSYVNQNDDLNHILYT